MPAQTAGEVGKRIAYQRRLARLTQNELAGAAGLAIGTLRKLEQGERGASDSVIDAIAAALGIDPGQLLQQHDRAADRIHQAMPGLSAVIATYDMPEDGPVRPLQDLRTAVEEAVSWRVAAQYTLISRRLPDLLAELSRALISARGRERQDVADLLASAYRTADAVAYKYGARDLSARLVDLMRWAAEQSENELQVAAAAYVRTETYFAARAHAAGLRVLEAAIDAAPGSATAARGALHMRAAVIAARATNPDSAHLHMAEARRLGDLVEEGVYEGTAFGPSSVRIHEVSVAVSLGNEYLQDALDVALEWKPPSEEVPAERRSGFYIEVARAQLWGGQREDAFESLKVARRIAPQHVREHAWVREDAATLRRLQRADREELSSFAAWCHASG